jgi:8-oxo-dGTP pyrophosphatase MutT (NUDIX family)
MNDHDEKAHRDPDRSWMYDQAGVIPYRRIKGELEILLITSRRGKHWVIPKGVIEPHLDARESAVQEAYEEAGVRGSLRPDAWGEYAYRKWGGTCRVRVFLLEVEAELVDWPESHFRTRRWVSLEEALRIIDQEGLRRLIQRISSREAADF